MTFLGRLARHGNFLGQRAASAGRYLGRHLPQILKGAHRGLDVLHQGATNPLIRQIGAKAGVGGGTFDRLAQGTQTAQAGLGMVPGLVQNASSGITNAINSMQPARQSLAALYNVAHAP